MRRNPPFERRANVAVKFCEGYSTSRCASSSSAQFFEAGDSLEDADRCGYMVVEEDTDEPASDDQGENFLERLPINAGRFWLPDTFEDLKEDQKTQLSICLSRWRQITAGNKMIRQMKQGISSMDVATKKVIWRASASAVQRVQATPDPMSAISLGGSHSALYLRTLIQEFVWRWFQIMKGHRPYRQARQAEALAEKAANEILLEECRKEVRRLKKNKIGVAFVKREKSLPTLPEADSFDGEWKGAATIRARVQDSAPQEPQESIVEERN